MKYIKFISHFRIGVTQSSQTSLQSFPQTSDSQQSSPDNSFTKMKEVKTTAEINGLQQVKNQIIYLLCSMIDVL